MKIQAFAQCGLFVGAWALGEGIVKWLHSPVPGSVVGLAIVLFAIATKILPLTMVRDGANLLLGEMILFFIPAVISIKAHPEFLSMVGVELLAAIIIGTVCVMVATSLAIELVVRLCRKELS